MDHFKKHAKLAEEERKKKVEILFYWSLLIFYNALRRLGWRMFYQRVDFHKALQLEKQREREMKKAREDMYEEKNKVNRSQC